MAERPVILVSAGNADTKSVTAAMASVRASGAEPMLIANHLARLGGNAHPDAIRAAVLADIDKADGVMIMGNNADIDPGDYKATTKHPTTKSERDNPEAAVRGAYEYELISETLKCKKPLLGVCGGMQRLNVLLGGSLHQHVPDLTGNETHDQSKADIAPFVPVIFVQTEAGTKLGQLAGGKGMFTPAHHLPSGVAMENSFHHQAVDKVGSGLVVSARSIEQGSNVRIIEAIEGDPKIFGNQFVMGTQWHPEFGTSELSANILSEFTQQSATYAREHLRASEALKETATSVAAGHWQERVRKSQAQTTGTNVPGR